MQWLAVTVLFFLWTLTVISFANWSETVIFSSSEKIEFSPFHISLALSRMITMREVSFMHRSGLIWAASIRITFMILCGASLIETTFPLWSTDLFCLHQILRKRSLCSKGLIFKSNFKFEAWQAYMCHAQKHYMFIRRPFTEWCAQMRICFCSNAQQLR